METKSAEVGVLSDGGDFVDDEDWAHLALQVFTQYSHEVSPLFSIQQLNAHVLSFPTSPKQLYIVGDAATSADEGTQ